MKFFAIFALLTVFTFTSQATESVGEITRASEATGLVSGYNVVNRDDKVNFGLVMPVLTKADIFDFKISTVVSPKNDVLEAIGQEIEVPSNVSIPEQKERYSFFTITLDKPQYTLPLNTSSRAKKLGVLEGTFPFKKVVDGVRNDQPLFDLVNDFKFNSFSIANIPSSGKVDLAVGQNAIERETRVQLNTNVPAGYAALGMALTTRSRSPKTYFPTDLKTLASRSSQSLKSTGTATPLVVLVPENTFSSLAASTKKPLSYSIAWGQSRVNDLMTPLSREVRLTNSEILIENSEINRNYTVLAYKATVFRNRGEGKLTELIQVEGLGRLPNSINVEGHINKSNLRVRIDIYAAAAGVGLSASTLEEAVEKATLTSRYEVDKK